jgi:hypothetical protein
LKQLFRGLKRIFRFPLKTCLSIHILRANFYLRGKIYGEAAQKL